MHECRDHGNFGFCLENEPRLAQRFLTAADDHHLAVPQIDEYRKIAHGLAAGHELHGQAANAMGVNNPDAAHFHFVRFAKRSVPRSWPPHFY